MTTISYAVVLAARLLSNCTPLIHSSPADRCELREAAVIGQFNQHAPFNVNLLLDPSTFFCTFLSASSSSVVCVVSHAPPLRHHGGVRRAPPVCPLPRRCEDDDDDDDDNDDGDNDDTNPRPA